MSAAKHLLDKKGKISTDRIPDRLIYYTNRMANWKADLALKDKNIHETLSVTNSLAAFYDEMKAELSTMRSYMEMLKDERAGEVYRMFAEDSVHSHNYNAIQQLIKADEDYIMY